MSKFLLPKSPPNAPPLEAEIELPTKKDFDDYIKTLPLNIYKVVSIRGEKVIVSKDQQRAHVYILDQNGKLMLKSNLEEIDARLKELKDPKWIVNEIEKLEKHKNHLEQQLKELDTIVKGRKSP